MRGSTTGELNGIVGREYAYRGGFLSRHPKEYLGMAGCLYDDNNGISEPIQIPLIGDPIEKILGEIEDCEGPTTKERLIFGSKSICTALARRVVRDSGLYTAVIRDVRRCL
jgi:hypothetical protein